MSKLDGEGLDKAHQADPITNPWGIYTRDPWPTGIALFMWFGSDPELRTRLIDGSFDLDGEPEDWEDAAEAMTAALAGIERLSPTAVDTLDAATNGTYDLEWIGHLDDLLTGESPTALEVRESWRGGEKPPGSEPAAPINASETEAFAEFLREYGF